MTQNKHWIERTDKDTHFTASGVQNAMLLETVGDLPNDIQQPNAITITRITVWSKQNLDWDVMLFNNATGQPSADADLHSMVDWVTFLTTDAVRIAGTGLYLYSVSGLSLSYLPDDRQFYIGLINRNATTKNAGTTGEAVVELQGIYE